METQVCPGQTSGLHRRFVRPTESQNATVRLESKSVHDRFEAQISELTSVTDERFIGRSSSEQRLGEMSPKARVISGSSKKCSRIISSLPMRIS